MGYEIGGAKRWSARTRLFAGCVVVLLVHALAGAQGPTIHNDARLTGREIFIFSADDQPVMLVRGGFGLTAGERAASANQAVVWVRDVPGDDGRTLQEVTVYLEGNVELAEPGQTRTSDSRMLITLVIDGKLQAGGETRRRDMSGTGLYQRALAARRRARDGALPTPDSEAAEEAGPSAAQPTDPDPDGQTLPPVVADVGPVETYPLEQGRAIVVGDHIYLRQGDPQSDLVLELRAKAGVIFTAHREDVDPKDARAPYSPDLIGLGDDEVVTGVYLTDDVIITRGERKMRAPEAFYDFRSDRAIVINPVFRTIQEQRNVPIYIRAREARLLSAREVYFRDARVSTSDFYTPSYSIGAGEARLKDVTPYDRTGERLGEFSYEGTMRDITFNIRNLPVFYWPRTAGDFTEANTALRRVSIGSGGRMGTGVGTEWDLFRLLGLIEPEGTRSRLDLEFYERGILGGLDTEYARQTDDRAYSGYSLLYGMWDDEQEDDFGLRRKNIDAPPHRGRALIRHKEFLPRDWELQFELSYVCDENFLEEFFRGEHFAGKEQETLLYAKKQKDNWALTSLVQARINDFLTQTASAPDLGFYLIGEPLGGWGTFYNESHAGVKRFFPADDSPLETSDFMARGDTRNELVVPLSIGPLNVNPYLVGRLTGWSDKPTDGETFRPYGQAGVKTNFHLWRTYDGARSRLWNINRLRHIITPQAAAWVAGSGANPDELFPMDPDIEQHLGRLSGGVFGVSQRLQTKRGPADEQKTVDWMRLDLTAGFYDGATDIPGDGRFFLYRPEYSLGRNHINADYTWNISDSTAFLAYGNYDVNDNEFDRINAGLAVDRGERLSYYIGSRVIDDLETALLQGGVNYQISRKYSLSVFEQYDFDFNSGENLAFAMSLTRKFERWYGALTLQYDRTNDDFGVFLTFWPEGVPEVRIGSGRVPLLGQSERN